MRGQDAAFLLLSLGTMIVGVFLPFLAEPLQWLPSMTMLTLLFVSFLSIDGLEVWHNMLHFPGAVMLLIVVKLVIMPLACWAVFVPIVPEYALGAALLGGSATAVAAPFLAFIVQADHVLVLVGLVTTSLLLPFVLPAVLAFVSSVAQVRGGINVDLPVWSMAANLAVMTVVPFIAAQFLRRRGARITTVILSRRHPIFLACISLSNIAIFSRYSEVILQSPQQVLVAFTGAVLVFAVLFILSVAVTWWMPPAKQLAFVISCVAMNNVLMLILSVEFFSVTEALLAAAYAVPFFGSVVFYRILARLRGHDPR